jgi:hypothetical protein
MARNSNKTRIATALAALSGSTALGPIATILENFVVMKAGENIADLEDATVSASKRKAKTSKKSKDEDDEKPARKTKKRASKDDDEDDKPARKTRKSKAKDEDDEDEDKPKRTRKVRATPFDEAPTMDDIYDFLENFEGEPVEGGIRELKPLVVEVGGDVDALTDGAETRSEKAEELGMFLAAHNAVRAKLMKHDAEDLEELLEELDLEAGRSKAKSVDAILQAIHEGDDEDDADDGDDDDADDGDEDDADEKPARKKKSKKSKKDEDDDDEPKKRKKSKKSKKSKDEDDGDDDGDDSDDDDDDEPKRKSKKSKSKKKSKKDEDLDDLDDLDDID